MVDDGHHAEKQNTDGCWRCAHLFSSTCPFRLLWFRFPPFTLHRLVELFPVPCFSGIAWQVSARAKGAGRFCVGEIRKDGTCNPQTLLLLIEQSRRRAIAPASTEIRLRARGGKGRSRPAQVPPGAAGSSGLPESDQRGLPALPHGLLPFRSQPLAAATQLQTLASSQPSLRRTCKTGTNGANAGIMPIAGLFGVRRRTNESAPP